MITLQEAKVGQRDHIAAGVIDGLQQDSLLLDRLVFDDAVAVGGHGSTLTYGYQQTTTPSVAGVRSINSDYTPGEAKRTEKTAKCAIMGGSFQLDRVIIGTAGEVDELAYQTEEKTKATASEFHNLVINGDAENDGEFDGLKKLLEGTDSELTCSVDVSTAAKAKSNGNELIDALDALVANVKGCNMILCNLQTLLKIRSCARAAGYYERNKDDFGRYVETFAGIELCDAGKYYDKTEGKEVDVIPTDATAGTAPIYAIAIGLDGFHGISPEGDKIVRTYMPDLNSADAVKKGAVELVAGVALKNSKKAAVLNGVKVKA